MKKRRCEKRLVVRSFPYLGRQCSRWATHLIKQANEYPPDYLMCAQHAGVLDRSDENYKISRLKEEPANE